MTALAAYRLPVAQRPIPAAAARTCVWCIHRLRRGTCAEPVAAGLAKSFGIFWAPDGHADTCAAFASRVDQEGD